MNPFSETSASISVFSTNKWGEKKILVHVPVSKVRTFIIIIIVRDRITSFRSYYGVEVFRKVQSIIVEYLFFEEKKSRPILLLRRWTSISKIKRRFHFENGRVKIYTQPSAISRTEARLWAGAVVDRNWNRLSRTGTFKMFGTATETYYNLRKKKMRTGT